MQVIDGDRQIESAIQLETLKFLAVGPVRATAELSGALTRAGHFVHTVADLSEATEVLLEQQFDAVLLPGDLAASEVVEFASAIRQFESQTNARHTPLLFVSEQEASDIKPSEISGIDGVVPESMDPDSLTLAIARLASALAVDRAAPAPVALAPELPILDVEELKAQVAFDNELLIELIDLYLSERVKQSAEMEAALASRDYPALARVAHTIKGSLGSLHATAARATSQGLELAARERDQDKCCDFLPALERQLDLLEEHLLSLRESLQGS